MPVRVASSYSDRVPVSASSSTLAFTLAALLAAAPAPTPLAPGRTTTVRLAPDLGVAVERAVPGRAFAHAVEADAEQRWSDGAALLPGRHQRVDERAARAPLPALERAIQQAKRERQRSTPVQNTHQRGRYEELRVQG